jgi:hypothetical protein
MAAQLAPAEADAMLERALAELPVRDWRVVDTRHVGPKGLRADFVVVGEPGVFVVAGAKATERARARAKLALGLFDAAAAVARLTGVRRDEVHAVLCVGADGSVDGFERGVTLCTPATLADTLTQRRDRLTREEMNAAAAAVRRSLRAGGKHRA